VCTLTLVRNQSFLLPLPPDFGLSAFFAGVLGGFFAALACVLAPALRLGALVSAGSASSGAAGAAATGFGSGLGLAVLVGFAPSVEISVPRIVGESLR